MTEMKWNDVIDCLVSEKKDIVARGWYVSTKIRKEILINCQNTIIRGGTLKNISWQNMGSGVYRVYLNINDW